VPENEFVVKTPNDQQARLEIARQIVQMFKPERIIYLSLSAITAAIIVYEAALTIHDKSQIISAGATLFGAGGIVAFNLARLLTMFNVVIAKVFGEDEK